VPCFVDLFSGTKCNHTELPAIIIFTKYDKLVTSATQSGANHSDKEKMWQYGEKKASEDFEKLCIRPWREAVGEVPLMVSSKQLYLLMLIV
jgi:hypothetical protein